MTVKPLHKKNMKIAINMTIGQFEAVIRMAKAVHNYEPLFKGMYPLKQYRNVAERGIAVIQDEFTSEVAMLEEDLRRDQ